MKPSIDVKDVPISQIEPNPENPNAMNDDILDALRDDISRRGFVQPILIRPIEPHSGNPKVRYRLVDGEHRWKVMGELGRETIPAVVTDESATDADVRMLTMNRLRGQMVPIRLAHLLADLNDRIDSEELTKRLGMEQSELDDLLDLAGVEEPAPQEPEEPEEESEEEPEQTVAVTVVATADQGRRIRALLPEKPDEQAQAIAEFAGLPIYNPKHDDETAATSDSGQRDRA